MGDAGIVAQACLMVDDERKRSLLAVRLATKKKKLNYTSLILPTAYMGVKLGLSEMLTFLLTEDLSIFISLFNQLDAQNLFYNKFYFMPLHVSSTCAYHQ